jgi:hypothetical protein
MLKLTYTENEFWLEHLAQSLEAWVQTRVLISLRASVPLTIEPSTAAFLLPAHLPALADLEDVAQTEPPGTIAIAVCDADYVEVCLEGTWVASNPENAEGIFVTRLSDRAETFLYQLWRSAESIVWLND